MKRVGKANARKAKSHKKNQCRKTTEMTIAATNPMHAKRKVSVEKLDNTDRGAQFGVRMKTSEVP